MARLFEHKDIEELAKHSKVPIINALTNFSHPCQILTDLMTIQEKKGKLKGINLTYLGDSNNNITHSLMYGCSKLAINLTVVCPKNKEFMPQKKVIEQTNTKVIHDPKKIVKNTNIIYTDTWMSYHIPEKEKTRRSKALKPFQVNSKLMSLAPKALFMHCLPAHRGDEVTNEVIDSKKSIVFDQAENRLHTQKAIILKLLNKI